MKTSLYGATLVKFYIILFCGSPLGFFSFIFRCGGAAERGLESSVQIEQGEDQSQNGGVLMLVDVIALHLKRLFRFLFADNWTVGSS